VHPTADELAATARTAGMTVVDQVVDDLSWDFGSTEAFTAWCAVGFGAWTDRLPEAARGDFVQDVVDAYAAATGSSSVFRFMQLRSTLRT
jgi:trans-aconitate 2-methyltransferase